MTNSVTTLMKSHRSIRAFTDQAITPEQLDTIFTSAQAASSSSFMQVISIVHIKDTQKQGFALR